MRDRSTELMALHERSFGQILREAAWNNSAKAQDRMRQWVQRMKQAVDAHLLATFQYDLCISVKIRARREEFSFRCDSLSDVLVIPPPPLCSEIIGFYPTPKSYIKREDP